MTDFGNSNIPHGYNDEGGRGLSPREIEQIEDNWDSIDARLGKKERRDLECYHCGKEARREGAMVVGGKLVCEDCYADLNLKRK